MKESTLHSLITAKVIHEQANLFCLSENRHIATAGLILLQDSLELILLALLIELGVDEVKNIEQMSFDQMLGELRSAGKTVAKLGTLKSLNKHRVLAKHFGQLAEPITVRNYLQAANQAIDSLLIQITDKRLHDIYLTDLLNKGESFDLLKSASINLENADYLEALLDIRKALYVEIEVEYSVYSWREYDSAQDKIWYTLMFLGWGNKAPKHTKNKDWISQNVQSPTDYVQIDPEALRLDAIEWGVNTAELESLRRLTPKVFRVESKTNWHFKYSANFDANEATQDNVQYCLDKAISIILKKQAHMRTQKFPRNDKLSEILPYYLGDSVYETASRTSNALHTVTNDFEYTFQDILTGFEGTMFYRVSCSSKELDENGYPVNWINGYLGIRSQKAPNNS
jgi:hypothetical protein